MKYREFTKKYTQENVPDVYQKLLLKAFETDLDHFPWYFSFFLNVPYLKKKSEYLRSVWSDKKFFSKKMLLIFDMWPKGCTQKHLLLFEKASNF